MIHHPIDIARMMREAGWAKPNYQQIAVAVCWGESRFNDQAINENVIDGAVDSVDRGLMQINSKWQPHVTEECAFDPICNLREAYQIYVGRDYSFSAWNVWRDKKHEVYLPQAQIAVEADRRIHKIERDLVDAQAELELMYEELSEAKRRFDEYQLEQRKRIFGS